jgi:hypothetical protein
MPEGTPHDARALNIQSAYSPDGKLRYNLKGIDPQHAEELGVYASDQGDLEGKRAVRFFASLRRATALSTLIHQRRLTPSCEGHAYRGENSGPDKDR